MRKKDFRNVSIYQLIMIIQFEFCTAEDTLEQRIPLCSLYLNPSIPLCGSDRTDFKLSSIRLMIASRGPLRQPALA